MKYLISLFVLMLAGAASAQPANINLQLTAGIYNLGVQAPPDADLDRVCIERVDVVPAVELVCVPAAPGAVVRVTITVPVTLNDDAELRGFAYDTSGNKSAASPNMAIVDFTAPAAPVLVP